MKQRNRYTVKVQRVFFGKAELASSLLGIHMLNLNQISYQGWESLTERWMNSPTMPKRLNGRLKRYMNQDRSSEQTESEVNDVEWNDVGGHLKKLSLQKPMNGVRVSYRLIRVVPACCVRGSPQRF